MSGMPAICFRDLIGESRRRGLHRRGSKRSEQSSGGESCDLSSCGGESLAGEFSDGGDSTTSSSSNASTVLKEWNGSVKKEMAGKKEIESDGVGLLCGLMLHQKKFQL